jgi:hypothetical protein
MVVADPGSQALLVCRSATVDNVDFLERLRTTGASGRPFPDARRDEVPEGVRARAQFAPCGGIRRGR